MSRVGKKQRPEVEEETDVWGPHVSEERSSRDVLVHTKDMYAYSSLTVSLDIQKT